MKRADLIRVVLVALIAGGASFLITRQLSPDEAVGDEVSWLIEEFSLSADQANEVRALHAAFRPICDAHCTEIMAVQRAWEVAPDLAAQTAAKQELELLKTRCHSATHDHVRSVAAVMSPHQGKRYLDLIAPLLSDHDHTGPFSLR